eukprot:CAMPEP_0168609608 /NCGR_PEP_ID=MMETSP0449_2-20121227/1304_1 /TAXON_ID=1082188 /ORGANISM="Strombidium rassoulzadegani, Strain ras09" /LENGTH=80 /DNA_ID=CAMNT_0008649777 /DNA_START=209 /DNA_END=448 /DNA_ORIENTATION=-
MAKMSLVWQMTLACAVIIALLSLIGMLSKVKVVQKSVVGQILIVPIANQVEYISDRFKQYALRKPILRRLLKGWLKDVKL